MTAQIRTACQTWHITPDWTDERLGSQIFEDRIDVLIDLSQHTKGNRLLVFARKPAPVQVTYLGFPGTTGLKTFDARISDPYIDPPGQTEHFYSEPIARLSESHWCFPAIDQSPPVGPLAAHAAGHITFGCLNKLSKVSPSALHTWCAILLRVPGSRVILGAPSGAYRQEILDNFAAGGIDPGRIELTEKKSLDDDLALYHRIDIALDPFPYNGGITTCNAMWMGVPVIALAGTAGVQRVGVSTLSNTGLPELIADTPEQYIRIAADLAGDLPRLSAMRQGMRDRIFGFAADGCIAVGGESGKRFTGNCGGNGA